MTYSQRIIKNNQNLRDCIDLVDEGGSSNIGNIPIEVSKPSDMDYILENATDADIGKAYIYTGESTEKYEKGAFYVITKAD